MGGQNSIRSVDRRFRHGVGSSNAAQRGLFLPLNTALHTTSGLSSPHILSSLTSRPSFTPDSLTPSGPARTFTTRHDLGRPPLASFPPSELARELTPRVPPPSRRLAVPHRPRPVTLPPLCVRCRWTTSRSSGTLRRCSRTGRAQVHRRTSQSNSPCQPPSTETIATAQQTTSMRERARWETMRRGQAQQKERQGGSFLNEVSP